MAGGPLHRFVNKADSKANSLGSSVSHSHLIVPISLKAIRDKSVRYFPICLHRYNGNDWSKWIKRHYRTRIRKVQLGPIVSAFIELHGVSKDSGVTVILEQGELAMLTHLVQTSTQVSGAMMFSRKQLSLSLLALAGSCGLVGEAKAQQPAHRHEQRADLWSWPLYNAWVPYRKEMNRPRFVGGYIASKIEPTSQEAMSWREHHAEGAYRDHRAGYVKTYYYPKPWEVLPIDPRPATPPAADKVPAKSDQPEAASRY